LAANTPAELVALAKANPKQLSYGSSGIGSVTHMGMELLQLTGNVEMLHVPYKGGSLAVNDIVGGQVDLYLSSFPSASQLMRAGKLKAIGVTTAERSPVAPDVPPLADALPGFSIELWWGIFGPKGMPDKLVAQINAEVRKAAESPAMKKFAESEGAVITNLNPDQFGKIYDHEIDSWQMVGEKTHVQIE
jgi:tripartite-type tricarboxylate transporter receptor subunit TctC